MRACFLSGVHASHVTYNNWKVRERMHMYRKGRETRAIRVSRQSHHPRLLQNIKQAPHTTTLLSHAGTGTLHTIKGPELPWQPWGLLSLQIKEYASTMAKNLAECAERKTGSIAKHLRLYCVA